MKMLRIILFFSITAMKTMKNHFSFTPHFPFGTAFHSSSLIQEKSPPKYFAFIPKKHYIKFCGNRLNILKISISNTHIYTYTHTLIYKCYILTSFIIFLKYHISQVVCVMSQGMIRVSEVLFFSNIITKKVCQFSFSFFFFILTSFLAAQLTIQLGSLPFISIK